MHNYTMLYFSRSKSHFIQSTYVSTYLEPT